MGLLNKWFEKGRIYSRYKADQLLWTAKLLNYRLRNKKRIALASYPRSGNTWLRLLLEGITGERTGTIYSGEGRHFAERGREGIVIKTHKNDTYRYTDAILLIRNPMNAIESYYFWKKERSRSQKDTIWEDHLIEGIESWKSHILAWENFRGNLMILKYEELVENPFYHIKRILRFLEIENKISEEKITQEINKNSIDNLRERYPQGGRSFFRQGKKEKKEKELFSNDDEKYLKNRLYPILKKYNYI